MLRLPTEREARDLLKSSGVRYQDQGHYFSCQCPFHKDGKENSNSSALYKDGYSFYCFTCGTSLPFSKLYYELKGEQWNEHETIKLKEEQNYYSVEQEKQRIAYAIEREITTSIYDNPLALSYARSRGINDEFIKEFNIKATKEIYFKNGSKWRDRVVIPIIYKGEQYSLEGRDYTGEQRAKCLYPKHCKTDILFNQDNLDPNKPLVITEGLMDIVNIWQNITKNVTCTFGVSLTTKQKEYLKECTNLIVYVDDDKAGHEIINKYEQFMKHDFKVCYTKGHDPGSAGLEENIKAIENAQHYGDYMIERAKLFENAEPLNLI